MKPRISAEPMATPQNVTLSRCLVVPSALLLTLSAITPASSVFAALPSIVGLAGTGAFLSMAAAALLSIPIAYGYAELSSAFPIAGGEYSLVGRTLGPSMGFVVLGMTIFSTMLSPAALALGAGAYITAVIPAADPVLVAVAIIAATTCLSLLHIRTNAWITGVFLLVELLSLGILTALGFEHTHRSVFELVAHPISITHGTLRASSLAAVGLATSIAIFAYDGSGSAIYFSEEMRSASRTVARTILWSLAITVLAELLPATAILVGAPDVGALLRSSSPISDFLKSRGGQLLSSLVSITVALAILNAVLASILQNARFFYSTGRDRTWHPKINAALLHIHPRFQCPWAATLVSGTASIAVCFLGLNRVLVLTGTETMLVYAAVCVAAISGRQYGTASHSTYRMPLYPAMPLTALAAICYVFYTSALDPVLGRPSLILNGLVVLFSLGYYALALRRKGSWILRAAE